MKFTQVLAHFCQIQTPGFTFERIQCKQCWITALLLCDAGPEHCLFLSNHHHQTIEESRMNSGKIQRVFALAVNEVNDRKLPDSHSTSAMCSFQRTLALPPSTFNFVAIKKQTSCLAGKTTVSTCHVHQRWKSVCDFVAQSGNSRSTRRRGQKMRGRQEKTASGAAIQAAVI